MQQELRTPVQEAAEDIFFGQVVIIWARWFLIAAGAILVLWSSSDPAQLAVAILPVVALMAMNFFLHGRYMMERPANQSLILLTSLIDLVIVSLIVLLWPGQNGLSSPFFIFYYPMVLSFGFVFPRRIEMLYTGLAIVAYAAVCLIADVSFPGRVDELKTLTLRLIVLGAMGGLANYYWRVLRARRRAAVATAP